MSNVCSSAPQRNGPLHSVRTDDPIALGCSSPEQTATRRPHISRARGQRSLFGLRPLDVEQRAVLRDRNDPRICDEAASPIKTRGVLVGCSMGIIDRGLTYPKLRLVSCGQCSAIASMPLSVTLLLHLKSRYVLGGILQRGFKVVAHLKLR